MLYSKLEEPQIEVPAPTPVLQPEQAQTSVLGALVRLAIPTALLVLGGVAYSYLSIEPAKEKTPPAEKLAIRTKVAKLRVEDYQIIIKTNGIVQSHNEVGLSAQVSGQIISISPAFEAGSYFSAGEVLVELDSRDYRTALAVADAQLLGAQSALELATETYERNKNLYDKNGVSEAVLNQSFAAQAQAAALLDTAIAQQDQAKRDLERTKIVAPFDGRVRTNDVGVGQLVGSGAPLGTVFAIDFAEVRLPIAGKELQYLDLPEVATDAPVHVELRDAINNDSETVWKAQIVRTEGTLDIDSLELFAIARIDDPFGKISAAPPLRIGQPVVASIAGKILKDVVLIPRIAVRQLDQVYFVDENDQGALTLTGKTLEPVWTDEEHLIIQDDTIEDGQRLAMTRIVYAPDGATVEIIPDVPEVELTTSNETTEAAMTTKPVSN